MRATAALALVVTGAALAALLSGSDVPIEAVGYVLGAALGIGACVLVGVFAYRLVHFAALRFVEPRWAALIAFAVVAVGSVGILAIPAGWLLLTDLGKEKPVQRRQREEEEDE